MMKGQKEMILLLLIPIIMIVYGLRWRRKPPAYPSNPDVGGWTLFLGYRTEWSLKSPDTWYYSHICYGRMILPLGIIALMFTIVAIILLPPERWVLTVLLIADLICIMIPYYPIEKKMRSIFDIKGRRKEDM